MSFIIGLMILNLIRKKEKKEKSTNLWFLKTCEKLAFVLFCVSITSFLMLKKNQTNNWQNIKHILRKPIKGWMILKKYLFFNLECGFQVMVEEVIYDFYVPCSVLIEIWHWGDQVLADQLGQPHISLLLEGKSPPLFQFPSLLLFSPILVFAQILACGCLSVSGFICLTHEKRLYPLHWIIFLSRWQADLRHHRG